MNQREKYKEALYSDLQKLKEIIKKDCGVLNYTFGFGYDSLCVACILGRINTVKYLIGTGVFDLNTVLQIARNQRCTDEIIAALQEGIANQESINNNAKSAYIKK
jgi:hypothetical protein